MRRLERLAMQRSALARQRVLHGTQQKRQRRPEFVADVAEEGGLRSIELGQRFRSLSFLLDGARVRDRRAELRGDQAEPFAIVFVEQAAGADAQHDRPDARSNPRSSKGSTIADEGGSGQGPGTRSNRSAERTNVASRASVGHCRHRPAAGLRQPSRSLQGPSA